MTDPTPVAVKGDNNPPAAVIELDADTASILMRHCTNNIHFMLEVLQKPDKLSDGTLLEVVRIGECYKTIRDQLKAQNIEEMD